MEAISEREAEVLDLVARRQTNAEIAARLFISVRTVESHVSALLRKTGAADRRELAGRAVPAEAPGDGTSAGDATDRAMQGAPRPFTTFVGRQRDIEEVTTALADSRLVTLVGPGGMGKTRLALEVGNGHGADRSWFVDLVPASPGLVVATVAAALGVAEQPDRSLVEAVCDELATTRGLMVLDNCEHVLDDVAALIDRVVRTSPDLVVLATSRESLGLPGERIVPIRPLDVAGADPSAQRLFRERAAASGAALGEGDEPLIEDICARLDGIPLAIELAAARCASLGLDGVAAGLDDRLRLLSGARGSDTRHRSLRDVLDWSNGLLDDDERRVLRRLSVFLGGFRAADAAVVVAGDLSPASVPDAIGRLAAKSLIASRQGEGGLVYRLLDTVRAYAHEQLDESGERSATESAHLEWSMAVAESLTAEIAEQAAVPRYADRVIDDLRAALTWGSAHGPSDTSSRLARALGHVLYARFLFVESRQRFEQAAELATDPAEAAIDLADAAHCAFALLLGDLGYRLFRAAADRAREAGRDDLAAELLSLAVERAHRYPAEFRDNPPDAETHALLAEAHALGDGLSARIDARLAVADAWTSTDNRPATTRPASERALRIAVASGDAMCESSAMDALAAALDAEGRLAGAADVSVDRRRLLARLQPLSVRHGAEQLDIIHMSSDSPMAFGDLPRALAITRDAFSHPLAAVVTHVIQRELVVALCLTGRFDEAIDDAEIMRAGWERVGRPVAGWMAPAAYLTSMVHGLMGRQAEADDWMDVGNTVCLVDTTPVRSMAVMRVALHQGRFDDALEELARREGIADGAAVVLPPTVSCSAYEGYLWSMAAEVWVASGTPDAAERLEHIRKVVGEHRWAEHCLTRAQGRLTGDEALLRAAADGFESLDAQFEAAATRALLPGAEGEAARVALSELGCTAPG